MLPSWLIQPLLHFWKKNSPYELLYNKIPNYSSFRVFDCLCYASTIPSYRSKFSPKSKAIAAVFTEYPPRYKGYKLYDLKTRRFFISGDVFHKYQFPFQCLSNQTNHRDHFHTTIIHEPMPKPPQTNSNNPATIPPQPSSQTQSIIP